MTTGFFNSRSGFVTKNYHYYVPSDVKLQDIGLASYTRNSLTNFGKRKQDGRTSDDPDIVEYLGNLESAKRSILGDNATLIIYRFDKDTDRYLLTTNNLTDEDNIFWTPSGGATAFRTLKTFQERFDQYQKGWIKHDSDNQQEQIEAYNIKYIWSKINNSLSGCISFDSNYTILGQPASGVINIFFQSKSDGSNKSIAFQPPVIAGVGRTPTGKEFAFGISETLDPGALSAPDVGGIKSPNNTFAGPLKLHINRGTGEWESGTTQILVRLLADLDGISQNDLVTNVDSVSNESQKLKFKQAPAMVITTEKGNPHLAVPVSFGCGVTPKEKVILINRTQRSYIKGEICLASQINGDWVPIPLINGSSVAKKINIEWSQIQKYIVNAKSFFRNLNDTDFITSSDYQKSLYLKYYNISEDPIKTLNISDTTSGNYKLKSDGSLDLSVFVVDQNNTKYLNMLPNYGFIPFLDADFISKDIGGNNTGTMKLINTNISKTEPYPELGVISDSAPCSWGMYFPKGYGSSKVSALKNNTLEVQSNGVAGTYSDTRLNFSSSKLGLFNVNDSNLFHLPAQFALNSVDKPTVLGWPLFSYNINELSSFAQSFYNKTALTNTCYLKIKNTNQSAYGLVPIDSSIIQFTPLSLELALNSTLIKPEGEGANNRDQGGYSKLSSQIASFLISRRTKNGEIMTDADFFGNGLLRFGFTKYPILEPDGSVYGPISFGKKLINYGLGTEDGYKLNNIGLPNRADAPDGGPLILPDAQSRMESSNVLGIIGAMGTFDFPGGGNIELKTTSQIGLNGYSNSTGGGGSVDFTFLGSLGSFFTDNRGTTKLYEKVQWGGSRSGKQGGNDILDLGSTSLWCSIYEHAPMSIYDARYFCPLQFNTPTGLEFNEVDLSIGTVINNQNIKTKKNSIRNNKLISNNGFRYIKKVIAGNLNSFNRINGGIGYKTFDEENVVVTFDIGDIPIRCKITSVDNNGQINTLKPMIEEYGLDAFGETANGGTSNPFKSGPIEAKFYVYPNLEPYENDTAKLTISEGLVIEKVFSDTLEHYGTKQLIPDDNDGQGNNGGFVSGSKTTSFSLPENKSGKYDIFLFFVNDILNYPEMGVTYGDIYSPAQFVNLEITAT